MKLTELIDELTTILKTHGNRETFFYVIDIEGEIDDVLLESKPEKVELQDDELHIGLDIAFD